MKSVSKYALSRRTMLRGIASGTAVSLALPPLEAMFDANGTAYAQGAPLPKYFGVFFWGNGVKLDRWTPSSTGTGWALSPELEPLADVRNYVSVVSGMNIRTGNERGHHAGTVGILSGSPMIPQDPMGAPYASTFSAPSIDQVVASALAERGVRTRFRSLEVGVTRRVVTGEGTTLRYLSHNGPDNPNPPEYSPRAVFDRIFGNGFVDPSMPTPPDPRLALRRSVLDAVLADARILRERLGSNDRQRIDQHMDSIRQLEQQLQLIEETPPPVDYCSAPSRPGDLDAENFELVSSTMSDLTAMALACDQTRVFSNMFSGSVSVAVYRMLSQSTNHHSLTHDEGNGQPQVHAITTYIMQQFAGLLAALRRIDMGAGNLLDQTAILASTDVTDGQGHTINDYPILVAGGAGGALRTPGVHVRKEGANTSEVLLTLLHALDIDVSEFGNGGGRVSSTVSELMS